MSVLRHLFTRQVKAKDTGPDTRRMAIDLTEAAYKRLEWIGDQSGAKDMAEVVKDALELREATIKLMLAGNDIMIRSPSGELTNLFLSD